MTIDVDQQEPKSVSLTRLPLTKLVGVAVEGRDGERIGTISEVMIDAQSGAIAYVAVAVGGVLNVGERLFAVPWACCSMAELDEPVRVTFVLADLDGSDGFDKDAWPSQADAALQEMAR
jgi:sporulation protein YlmC with PRC-barrel domain